MKALSILKLIVFGGLQLAILSSAGAEDCSKVDLAPQMGPVRDQGDVGWCYANAASDLLSFRYRTELHGKPVSAFYTALSYTDRYYNNPLVALFVAPKDTEGGSISFAMKNAMNQGFCPGLSAPTPQPGLEAAPLKEKLTDSSDLKDAYDRHDQTAFTRLLTKIRKTDSFMNQLNSNRLIQVLRGSNSANFLKVVADTICQGKKIVPSEKAWIRATVAQPHTFLSWTLTEMIDRQITLRNPVGVDYLASFFRGWDVAPDLKDAHASVIVGREMRGNTCYYKLRNSWGTACDYENPLFKQGVDCDKGYLWVPKEKFTDYLFAVTFLEPKHRSLRERFSSVGFAF